MGLSLSPADAAALDEKTEGWIVGLQLAAIALQSAAAAPAAEGDMPIRERADPSRFIASLGGSHRFILRYLTEEVLNQQPEEIRDFLLQTAILDRLSGALCDAVTGRTDGQLMLERLFNANLFLRPLDDTHQWYRYDHLFADLIRGRQQSLQPERTAELHRRASRWYAQVGGEARLLPGERGAFVGEAVQHALAASDYGLALQLVEGQALGMIMLGYFKTVEGWMQAIPLEYSASRPRANMAFAWMHFLKGTLAQATPYLERLQAIFSGSQMDETDASLQAEWLALQSIVRNTDGKPTESLALANQALGIVPEMDHHVQSMIYIGLADAYQQLDDHARAAEAFQRIVYHSRAASDLLIEMVGVERSGSLPPISAAVYGALGHVYYQWDQLKDARRCYLRATQVSALSGYRDAEIFDLVTLSRLYETEGDLQASTQEIERAVDLLQGGAAPWARREVIAQQVRACLAQDDPATAEGLLRSSGVSPEDEVTYATDPLHLAWLRWMLYGENQEHRKDRLQQASELAHRIIASTEAGQRVEANLQALILGALVHSAMGGTTGSRELLQRALELAEPEGYIRIFLDEGAPLAGLLRRAQERGTASGYARELLARFSSAATPVVPPAESAGLIEPLSERELEVLRLIRQGCSNEEIAQRLVITLYTVKKHNSNIYGKLGVNSRTQAVARARELGLL